MEFNANQKSDHIHGSKGMGSIPTKSMADIMLNVEVRSLIWYWPEMKYDSQNDV